MSSLKSYALLLNKRQCSDQVDKQSKDIVIMDWLNTSADVCFVVLLRLSKESTASIISEKSSYDKFLPTHVNNLLPLATHNKNQLIF